MELLGTQSLHDSQEYAARRLLRSSFAEHQRACGTCATCPWSRGCHTHHYMRQVVPLEPSKKGQHRFPRGKLHVMSKAFQHACRHERLWSSEQNNHIKHECNLDALLDLRHQSYVHVRRCAIGNDEFQTHHGPTLQGRLASLDLKRRCHLDTTIFAAHYMHDKHESTI